jgi:hypothetical protein
MMSNHVARGLLAAACVMLPAGAAPLQGQAQVGHDPEHSPYHDLRATHQLTLSGGYLAGSGGRVGVGPRQGPLFGLRYSLSLGAMELRLGVHDGNLQRKIMDPTAPPDKQVADTVRQQVLIADGGFSLRLTGAKTWHGFMPYLGATAGIAAGTAVLEDNSGFTFSKRFTFGPHLGVRYYGGGSLGIWVEGWDPMWRLVYPLSFFQPSTGVTPLLVTGTDPGKEWVHNPTLMVGFSLTMR